MNRLLTWLMCMVCSLAPLGWALAQDITGFTVRAQEGRCFAVTAGARSAIEVDKTYAFGTTLITERRSSIRLEFSPGNEFIVRDNTSVVVTEDTTNPKLKKLQLQRGQVDLTLDQFPKDHKLQVETPTAVCGAVGTRFVVTFESAGAEGETLAKAGTREGSFSCSEGKVFVASRFSVKDAAAQGETFNVPSLGAGSELVATIHEGLENSYTDITVNRGKLTFQYGGEKSTTLTVEPEGEGKPSRFVCALEKSDQDVTLAAVKVESGKVASEKSSRFLGLIPTTRTTDITPDDGGVIVKAQEVQKEEPTETEPAIVESYLAAAQTEGRLHSQWVDITGQGLAAPALEAELKTAAGKATELRKQLEARRTLRMLNQIRRGANKAATQGALRR